MALSTPTDEGVLKVKNAARKRQILGGNTEIIDRIDTYLSNEPSSSFKWHRNCYALFTQKDKIDRLAKKKSSERK